MKTLSDNLDIKLKTTGMLEGYVITTIYADGIGVFSGRSYIPGDDSSLIVNINDIACQNRGKYDYLKLTEDGNLETMPLVNYTSLSPSVKCRFNRGQVYAYNVNITDNTSSYSDGLSVLTGYDYVNRDLKPLFAKDIPTDLCRIMQGCSWIDDSDYDEGSFDNLLLPHYPYVKTDKYGFGLQLYNNRGVRTAYSVRFDYGVDCSLGSGVYGSSNLTFLTLKDLIELTYDDTIDYDTSLFLKLNGVDGDEFGEFEIAPVEYKGHVILDKVKVTGVKNGVSTVIGTYEYGATYLVYVNKYYRAAERTNWDIDAIEDGNTEVYTTNWGSLFYVNDAVERYEEDYGPIEVAKTSQAELLYDKIIVEPLFKQVNEHRQDEDKYIGTCPVAVFDKCYSRYYLAWNDRYGDIMSQPFDGKVEYTEGFDTTEMMDYKMRRRVIHNEVQPKWKLNTKWLSQDIYPMYESIFVSPYVLLYDTQTDRSWNVIITNSEYKEKTFRTEKSLFNLELNVELNIKQNYIF